MKQAGQVPIPPVPGRAAVPWAPGCPPAVPAAEQRTPVRRVSSGVRVPARRPVLQTFPRFPQGSPARPTSEQRCRPDAGSLPLRGPGMPFSEERFPRKVLSGRRRVQRQQFWARPQRPAGSGKDLLCGTAAAGRRSAATRSQHRVRALAPRPPEQRSAVGCGIPRKPQALSRKQSVPGLRGTKAAKSPQRLPFRSPLQPPVRKILQGLSAPRMQHGPSRCGKTPVPRQPDGRERFPFAFRLLREPLAALPKQKRPEGSRLRPPVAQEQQDRPVEPGRRTAACAGPSVGTARSGQRPPSGRSDFPRREQVFRQSSRRTEPKRRAQCPGRRTAGFAGPPPGCGEREKPPWLLQAVRQPGRRKPLPPAARPPVSAGGRARWLAAPAGPTGLPGFQAVPWAEQQPEPAVPVGEKISRRILPRSGPHARYVRPAEQWDRVWRPPRHFPERRSD